tara:strand:- start:2701 stop:3615 length:915 start_codon:yes stop_codon:yes gene_type:complete
MRELDSTNEVRFHKDVIFGNSSESRFAFLKQQRDIFASKFARNITLLLESKKPKKVFSRKGLLDPRKVYKHSFDDSIFYRKTSTPTSDTTIVFLIDGSGSMDCNAFNNMTRLEVCNVLASAFAKAVKRTVNNEVKVEVFLKSAPSIIHKPTTGTDNGAFPILTRLFTNTKQRVSDYDSLLKTDTITPMEVNGRTTGSYTAELAVMPALLDFMRKNIVTKNVVLLNITDGESWCELNDYTFGDAENRQMRMKYLRSMPHLNIMISGRYKDNNLRHIYGDNLLEVDNDSFCGELFKHLNKLMEGAV